MKRLAFSIGLVCLCALVATASEQDYTWTQLDTMDEQLTRTYQGLERHKADPTDLPANQGWILRSNHFVFGMPRLLDRRHDFSPDGETDRPGISVVVREGFVVAHFDRMRAPLFVCQRWTKADYHRMEKTEAQSRPWKEDLELPMYARAGTSYDGMETDMGRGHMARHADNRAWGIDNSKTGCRMSNSAPQHRDVNRGAGWRGLEDAVQQIVVKEGADIEVIWTISGTLYRDEENPDGEAPEDDFANAEFVGGGFGVPKATYKIVGWFDRQGYFQARGYVFEQTDREPEVTHYLTPIDEIEERAGVDFFPMLKNYIEKIVEGTEYDNMWGSE